MPHTKFQSDRPFGSREEDFYTFLPYMSMAATVVVRHKPVVYSLLLFIPWSLHKKFGFNQPSSF